MRVLAELGSSRLDREGPALRRPTRRAPRSSARRLPAYQRRHEDGRTIPEQRTRADERPDSAEARTARAGRRIAGAPVAVAAHGPSTATSTPTGGAVEIPTDLTSLERELLADLFAIVEEHADEVAEPVDRDRVVQAFVFACEHHADQRRQSGEDFIVHPVGVAKICAGMRLDTETLCAALLHDTVEDTTASLDEVRERSARRSPASSTASPSSPASRSSRATRRRPRTTAR